MSWKYKNVTDNELMLPGVGTVAAGAEIETDIFIENPNLQLVSGEQSQGVVATEQPQVNVVVDAQPVDDGSNQ